jgi:hypothetical protein
MPFGMIITEKSVVAKPLKQAGRLLCGLPVRAAAVNPVRNSIRCDSKPRGTLAEPAVLA